MSMDAPWLAISTDWMDSEMFDEATHGERLAWICLLCHAKAHGRTGRVRVRKGPFIQAWRLGERAYDGMIDRALKSDAIEVNGDFITISNWRIYQDKAFKAKARRNETDENGKKVETSTTYVVGEGLCLPVVFKETVLSTENFARAWLEWEQHRKEIRKKLTPTATTRQAKSLMEMGHDRAIRAIRHSIAQGYTGIFEPDERTDRTGPKAGGTTSSGQGNRRSGRY